MKRKLMPDFIAQNNVEESIAKIKIRKDGLHVLAMNLRLVSSFVSCHCDREEL